MWQLDFDFVAVVRIVKPVSKINVDMIMKRMKK